jgi:hypothetical protein
MSKIALPAVYHSDTFSSSRRHSPSRHEPAAETGADVHEHSTGYARASGTMPFRQPDFLVQLMQNIDPALRRSLGRRDVAEHREAAYGAAQANRPSRKIEPARLFEITA